MNTKALMMILGSLVGFLIGTGFGLASSSPWPSAFLASVRCGSGGGDAHALVGWPGCPGLRDHLEKRSNTTSHRSKGNNKI